MKTKRKLATLKKERTTLDKKLFELTEEELEQVSGGAMIVNHNMAAINELTQLTKNNGPINRLD